MFPRKERSQVKTGMYGREHRLSGPLAGLLGVLYSEALENSEGASDWGVSVVIRGCKFPEAPGSSGGVLVIACGVLDGTELR